MTPPTAVHPSRGRYTNSAISTAAVLRNRLAKALEQPAPTRGLSVLHGPAAQGDDLVPGLGAAGDLEVRLGDIECLRLPEQVVSVRLACLPPPSAPQEDERGVGVLPRSGRPARPCSTRRSGAPR